MCVSPLVCASCASYVLCFFSPGVTARWIGVSWRRLLHSGSREDQESAFRETLSCLRRWYKTQEKLLGSRGGEKRLKKLGRGFSIKQLGKPTRPCFKGKATEARHLLPWLLEELSAKQGVVEGGAHLFCAGQALMDFYTVMSRERGAWEPDDAKAVLSHCVKFVSEYRAARARLTVKFHYLLHLAHDAVRFGSPALHHTYPDERFLMLVQRQMGRKGAAHGKRAVGSALIRLRKVSLRDR